MSLQATTYMNNERSYIVWNTVLGNIAYVRQMLRKTSGDDLIEVGLPAIKRTDQSLFH